MTRRVALLPVLAAGLLVLVVRWRPARDPSPPAPEGEAAAVAARLLGRDGSACHEAVAADLDRLRALGFAARAAGPGLARLLHEGAPLYHGRGPNEANRLRGYVLATLADVGPPDEALAALREILLLENHPYLLAAAARAAAAMEFRAAAIAPAVARVIDAASANDPVCLDAYNAPPSDACSTTPRAEALHCLERIGPGPSCCDIPSAAGRARLIATPSRASALADVAFTDQDGERRTWDSLFDRPAAVAFFYTGCDNPRKCSDTVARFGALQRAAKAACLDQSVRLALITLDPVNDSPVIARRYAEARGFEPGAWSAVLSTPQDSLERVVSALDAAAGFGEGRVNVHGVELFVLERGRLATCLPSDWAEDDVVRRLRAAAAGGAAESR